MSVIPYTDTYPPEAEVGTKEKVLEKSKKSQCPCGFFDSMLRMFSGGGIKMPKYIAFGQIYHKKVTSPSYWAYDSVVFHAKDDKTAKKRMKKLDIREFDSGEKRKLYKLSSVR